MIKTSPLVGAPLASTLFRLAVPGVVGALLFSGLGLVEATFVKSAGADALAAVALVFPLIILAAMFSAGAIGGAVSGRTARAIGAGNEQEASAVLVCAVVISLVGGVLMWGLVVQFGPLLYEYASDSPAVIQAAERYASFVFPAIPLFWLVNMLCSVLRGSGDMVSPAIVAAVMLLAYTAVATTLIPGQGGELNEVMESAALAMVITYVASLAVAIYFIVRETQPIRFRLNAFNLVTLKGILRQGTLAGSQSLMTVSYALVTTAIFSRYGTDWLAGFGLAVRLELIMVPVIFGVGASLIAIVGAYVGAGMRERAIEIAWRGILINVALVGCVGLLFAFFPGIWCGFVGSDPTVVGHCSLSLRFISPTYALFALGLGCYFASQGLDTLKYPVLGALLRLLIATTGLFWVTEKTPINVSLLLVVLAVAVYGLFVAGMLKLGPWRQETNSLK